jgi:hypothetical protein
MMPTHADYSELDPKANWFTPEVEPQHTPSAARLAEHGADDAQIQAALDTEIAATRNEIARCDTKAIVLLVVLTLIATALGFVLQDSSLSPWGVKAAGLAAFAMLSLSSWGMVQAIKLQLPRNDASATGLFAYAQHESGEDLLERFATQRSEEVKAADLHKLSRLATAKFQQLRWATTFMLWSLPLTALALLAHFIR